MDYEEKERCYVCQELFTPIHSRHHICSNECRAIWETFGKAAYQWNEYGDYMEVGREFRRHPNAYIAFLLLSEGIKWKEEQEENEDMSSKSKRGGGAKKGTPFEREVSKKMSLWWSKGERDDLVWHTHCSGGRATVRKRDGRSTAYQYGDLTPTHPEIFPLFDMVVWELKRGYNAWSFVNVVDKAPHMTDQFIEKWLDGLMEDVSNSGAKWGFMVCRRDQRREILIAPYRALQKLIDIPGNLPDDYVILSKGGRSYISFPLDTFFEVCEPDKVLEYCNKKRTSRRSKDEQPKED